MMKLQQIETLLLQEMEDVKGGIAGASRSKMSSCRWYSVDSMKIIDNLRFLLLSTVVLLTSVTLYGKTIVFSTPDKNLISGVTCIGFQENGDSVSSWVSNNEGIIDIQNAQRINYLTTSHSQFSDKIIFYKDLNEGENIVILSPAISLEEVVVTPDDVQEFRDHTSYRLTMKDMSIYANVLQSLNEIPNLTVLSNGAVFFEGNQNVKILINGVEATIQEIQTLSKEDINKVDVYQTPPLRFLNQGISAVLDIKLKSKIYGGNGGLDLSQAFQSLKGNNSIAFYYNYRQSRFSVLYNNENSHYKKFQKSEVLNYEYNGICFNKNKEGLDSKNHYDNNNINLSYQINQPQKFLYNVKAEVDFNRNGGTSLQNVKTPTESFLATNLLRTDYTKYIVGNYFERNFGENAGTFLANVNYQHFSTSYNSAYNELSESDAAVNNSMSNYKTHLDAIFSEIQYQLPYNKLGSFTISAHETYKHSKYVDTLTPFYQTTNTFGGAAQWLGMKGSVRWWLSLGADWYHTASTVLENSHNLFIPTPRVNIHWRASNRVQFLINYSYTGNVPTIAQLSETNQWIDTRLVYHGNSTLKPYKTHATSMRFIYNNYYLNLSLLASFNSSPNRICDMYTLTNDYVLQTLVNLSSYKESSVQCDISIKPLGNSKLVFWNRVIFADIKGKNIEYSWDGYRIQWMSDLSLNLKHWTVDLFYQYPGKIVEGQLERPRAQCWSATVLYRPNTNLSFGIEWFMPFGNGFKESEHTVNTSPVYADSEYKIRDRSNMLSIKLSYNFGFGRNKNKAAPQYDNRDNDSGILQK